MMTQKDQTDNTPRPKKGDVLEMQVDDLAFGGMAIGNVKGWKLFVDRGVPEDLLEVRVQKSKSRYGEAKALRVLKASKHRIEAVCPHFDVCGGCPWQNMDVEFQAKHKEKQVREVLKRIGDIDEKITLPIIKCEKSFEYRNKVEFSFGPGNEVGKAMLGFYPSGFHYEVFDLHRCHLASERVSQIAHAFRDFAHKFKFEAYHSGKNSGFLRSLIIRESHGSGELMAIINSSPASDGLLKKSFIKHLKELFATLSEEHQLSSLHWNQIRQKKGQSTFHEWTHIAGSKSLEEILRLPNGEELRFTINPSSFFQTNTLQAEKLYSCVLEFADLKKDDVLYDLYCGTGSIGLFCAHAAGSVYGVEIHPASVENAKLNAEKNGIENAHFFEGSTDEALSVNWTAPAPDVIVVDPPRNGLNPEALSKISSFGAKKIIYVSCNPASLARDLKQFALLGYESLRVQPIDMFPQTAHVECVVELKKT